MLREPQPSTLGHERLEEDEAEASFATRLGTVVGGGVLAAIAASLPAELRIGDGGSLVRAFEQWLALAALLTPLSILMVAVLRRGRTGLHLLAGVRAPLFIAAALWWAVLELGVLSVFGAILRAKTHHHGLAGVTFAMLALVSGVIVGLLAIRGVRMLTRMPAQGYRLALSIVGVTSFLVLLLVGFRTARAEGIHTAGALLDMLALLLFASIASTRVMARWRPLAVGGMPIAAAILLLGYATVRAEPDLSGLLAEGAPVQAWLLGLLGR